MHIYPIILDSRPRYLQGSEFPASILLLPLGTGTLLEHVRSRVATVTDNPPVVFASFPTSATYEAEIRAASGAVRTIVGPGGVAAHLEDYEPSDFLLVIDPSCLPVDGLDPRSLLRHPTADPRWARYLVALDHSPDGTRECVAIDAVGRVRRIQRFFDTVTWPFTAGVCCGLLPAAGALVAGELPWGSLTRLRQALATRGVPGRDLPVSGRALDLTDESGVLSLSERFVLEAVGTGNGSSWNQVLYAGRRHRVHRTARLLGPVVVQDEAIIEEDAIVLGPAVIGQGARIGHGALVAQCVLGQRAVVPPGMALRHRVLFAPLPSAAARDGKVRPTATAPETLGPPASPTTRPALYTSCKPLLEGALALVALAVLSPLLLLIAVLIKLDSRGPVLYGHKREGRNGRVFRCWKFRTMYIGAETRERELYARNQVDGPQFKLDCDPRLTRVGRWLRPMSLDELPQLLNVVMGQMSLVGPRPSPFRENQLCVPWREGRLSVRPGITGLWQVCRDQRTLGDFHQWIHYDLLYVRHLSLWLDLKILVATVLTVGGKGRVPLTWIMPDPAWEEQL